MCSAWDVHVKNSRGAFQLSRLTKVSCGLWADRPITLQTL